MELPSACGTQKVTATAKNGPDRRKQAGWLTRSGTGTERRPHTRWRLAVLASDLASASVHRGTPRRGAVAVLQAAQKKTQVPSRHSMWGLRARETAPRPILEPHVFFEATPLAEMAYRVRCRHRRASGGRAVRLHPLLQRQHAERAVTVLGWRRRVRIEQLERRHGQRIGPAPGLSAPDPASNTGSARYCLGRTPRPSAALRRSRGTW
jgi:hypothetical protein